MTLSLALSLLLTPCLGLILGALVSRFCPDSPPSPGRDQLLAGSMVLSAGLLLYGVPVFVSFLVLLVISVITGWGLGQSHIHNPTPGRESPLSVYEMLLFLPALAAAFLFRFLNLGDFGFRIDEIRHFRAAVGYLNTGTFGLWSFQGEILYHPYDRAWMYTWQVAQVFQSFGVDLFVGRLVSLFWGIVMFLPVYLLVRELRVPLTGRLTALTWLAMSPVAISVSRWLRMYAMFITVFLVTIWLLLRLLKARTIRSKLLYGGLATGLWGVSVHLHRLSMGILPALIVYFCLEHFSSVRNWIQNKSHGKLISLLVGLGIASTGLIVGWLSLPVGLDNLLGEIDVDTRFFWVYLPYLLGGAMPYGIGGLLIGVVLYNLPRGSREQRFLVLQILIPILGFILLTDRFPQMRYVSHLSILAIPVLISGLTDVLRPWNKTIYRAMILLVIGGLLGSFSHSYPRVRNGHMGYLGFPGQNSPQYHKAIKYLRDSAEPGDIIIGYNLPEYYAEVLSRPGIRIDWVPRSLRPFETLPKLHPEDLKRMEQQYDRVWLLTLKKFNGLNEPTTRYLREHYRDMLKGTKTMLHLYHHPRFNDPGRRKNTR